MEDEDYCYHAVWAWNNTIDFHTEFQTVHKSRALFDDEDLRRITGYINDYSGNMIDLAGKMEDSKLSILTVLYTCKAGAPTQLWYSIDGGEKQILNANESIPLFLDNGHHSIATLNPLNKKRYEFVLDGAKTINVFCKGIGMSFSEN